VLGWLSCLCLKVRIRWQATIVFFRPRNDRLHRRCQTDRRLRLRRRWRAVVRGRNEVHLCPAVSFERISSEGSRDAEPAFPLWLRASYRRLGVNILKLFSFPSLTMWQNKLGMFVHSRCSRGSLNIWRLNIAWPHILDYPANNLQWKHASLFSPRLVTKKKVSAISTPGLHVLLRRQRFLASSTESWNSGKCHRPTRPIVQGRRLQDRGKSASGRWRHISLKCNNRWNIFFPFVESFSLTFECKKKYIFFSFLKGFLTKSGLVNPNRVQVSML